MEFFDQLNIVDYLVLVVTIISMVMGLWRGFILEFMSILPWVGAVCATIYGTPVLLPHFYKVLSKSFLTEAIAMASIFIVTCVFLSILRPGLKEKVRESSLSGLDRLLGLVFGALRGVAIFGALYIAVLLLTPYDTWPQSVQSATTMPYINNTAHVFTRFLPASLQEKIQFPDGHGKALSSPHEEQEQEKD